METSTESENKPLSDMEIMFVEDYLTNGFNKTKAAKTAGISERTAMQQGWQIYNRPHVKEYIQNVLKERIISSAENQKLISDTAQASLTDYYRPVPTIKYNKIKVGLQHIIDNLQDEIDFEDEVAAQLVMDKAKKKSFDEMQAARKVKLIRYKTELKRNPEATRIIDSEPVLVDEMQLDINELVADKEKGKVKSIAYTPSGLKVEMYSAENARDMIAKMHGDYQKDNEQKASVINTSKLSDDDLKAVIELSKKASADNS